MAFWASQPRAAIQKAPCDTGKAMKEKAHSKSNMITEKPRAAESRKAAPVGGGWWRRLAAAPSAPAASQSPWARPPCWRQQ